MVGCRATGFAQRQTLPQQFSHARAPENAHDWDHLFATAAAQDGLVTTQQAAEAGHSPRLLAHHLGAGRILRVRRGIYRLVHFPAGDHQELTAIWLSSEMEGVRTFSHQTALARHDLSDVLPAHVHLTLPAAWRSRRQRVPDCVVVYYADVARAERRWFGPLPATAPFRTLEDCAAAQLVSELLREATREAGAPGLVARSRADRRPHRGRALRRSRTMTQAYRTAAVFKVRQR